MSKISVVVPVYNEAQSIQPFIKAIAVVLGSLEKLGYSSELVFVNDGSTDESLEGLLRLMEHDSRLRIIDLSRNFGKEAALTAGLDEATGDATVIMDADLQDPPDLLPELIAKWREGFDVVLARRTNRSSDSILKRLSARWFYKIHNLIADHQIPHDVGDFRLLDRSVVDALRHLPERRRFMKGLFSWVGFRTTAIDYSRKPRKGGNSKFSGWKLWNLALEGITSFSTAPLRLWTYIGITVSASAFAYLLFIIIRTFILGVAVPGYASIFVAVLFFGGLQLIGIGVIGEYLGRVYIEVKQRPTYIVRRRYAPKDHTERLAELDQIGTLVKP